MRRSSTSFDCSPRTLVASQASRYMPDQRADVAVEQARQAVEGLARARLAARRGTTARSPSRRAPRRSRALPDAGEAVRRDLAGRPRRGRRAERPARSPPPRRDATPPLRVPPAARARVARQRRQQRLHRRPALRPGRCARPRSRARRSQPGTRRGGRRRRAAAAQHVVGQLGHRRARERPLAVQRLVQRDAEAELIAARVGHLAAELLGRHVGGRSHQEPGLR